MYIVHLRPSEEVHPSAIRDVADNMYVYMARHITGDEPSSYLNFIGQNLFSILIFKNAFDGSAAGTSSAAVVK